MTTVTHEKQLATIVSDLLAFNGATRTEFTNKGNAIQKEIDEIVQDHAAIMVDALYTKGGELDVPKPLDADIILIGNAIVDKCGTSKKRLRDDSISDLVKRINRCFKRVADAYAMHECKDGKLTGTLSYPNLGRSIQEGTITTKWSTKELTWQAKQDKDNKVTGVQTNVTSASASNNKGNTTTEQGEQITTPEQLAQAIAATVQAQGFTWDAVLDELAKVATLSKGHKVQFKREEAKPTTDSKAS